MFNHFFPNTVAENSIGQAKYIEPSPGVRISLLEYMSRKVTLPCFYFLDVRSFLVLSITQPLTLPPSASVKVLTSQAYESPGLISTHRCFLRHSTTYGTFQQSDWPLHGIHIKQTSYLGNITSQG